jgi:uncharacterized membrane protein YhaH (DUF805 family)/predicted MFS family arabinose efflux permease
LVLLFGWAANLAQRVSLNALIPVLLNDLGISVEQISRMFNLFVFGLIPGYVLMTVVTVVFGPRRGLVISFVGASLAAFIPVLAFSGEGFLASRVALGFFTGGLLPAMIQAIREWFPSRERPLAIGLLFASSFPVILGGLPLFRSLGDALGGKAVLVTAGLLTLLPAAACAFAWRFEQPRERSAALPSGSIVAAAMLAVGLLFTYPIISFAQIWRTVFQDELGIDADQLASSSTAGTIAGAFGGVIVGAVALALMNSGRSSSKTRAMLLTACGGLLALAAIVGAISGWSLVIVWTVVISMAHQGWSTLLHSAVADALPRRGAAAATAIAAIVLSVVGYSTGVGMPRISGSFSLGALFVLMATTTVIAALVVLLAAWRVPQEPVGDATDAAIPLRGREMTFSDWFISFDGRLNRSRFWLGSLVLVPLWLGGAFIDLVTTESIGFFYFLGIVIGIVPTLALNIKRCHDRGRSGWFYLVALIPLVSFWYLIEIGFMKGDDGDNMYGPDPLIPLDESP